MPVHRASLHQGSSSSRSSREACSFEEGLLHRLQLVPRAAPFLLHPLLRLSKNPRPKVQYQTEVENEVSDPPTGYFDISLEFVLPVAALHGVGQRRVLQVNL